MFMNIITNTMFLLQKVEVQTAINADEKSTDIESVQWLNFVIKHW